MIMTTDLNNQKTKRSYYKERFTKQNTQQALLPKGLAEKSKKLRKKLTSGDEETKNLNAGQVTVETDNEDLVVVQESEFDLERTLKDKDVKIPSNLSKYTTDRGLKAASVVSRSISPMIKISNQIESREKKHRLYNNRDSEDPGEYEDKEGKLNRTLYGMKDIEGKRASAQSNIGEAMLSISDIAPLRSSI